MRKTRILAAIVAAQTAWAAGTIFAQMPQQGTYPASAWNGYPFPAQSAPAQAQLGFTTPSMAPQGPAYQQTAPAYQLAALNSAHKRCDKCAPVPGVSVGLCAECQSGMAQPMVPAAPVQAPVVAGPTPAYMGGQIVHEGAVSDAGCVNDYAAANCGGGLLGCGRPRWFVSLGGIVMDRDRPNTMNLSYISGTGPYPPNIVLQTPGTEWTGGGEINFGRSLGCRSALYATYWGLAPVNVYERYLGSSLGAGGLISSTLDETTPTMTFSDGRLLEDYFDDSPEHRVFRDYEIHNVEINYVIGLWGQYGGGAWPGCFGCGGANACGYDGGYAGVASGGGFGGFSALQRGRMFRRGGMGGPSYASCGPDACGGCGTDPCGCRPNRFRGGLLMGARFFRFDESLTFGAQADNGGAGWDANGGADHAFINTRLVNNLWGYQMGAPVAWNISDCFALFAVPKFGIYGADISKEASIYRGDGDVAFERTYNKQDFSILSSLDAGANLCWGPRWSFYGGYRVLSISGLALADNNIPRNVTVPASWGQVYSNGHMILHGAFAGGQFSF